MPFPFHRLHCDLQKRLRILTAPSELYHLQIAIGDADHYLHPLQLCYDNNNGEVSFLSNLGTLYLSSSSRSVPVKDNTLSLIKELSIDDDVTEAWLKVVRAHAILDVYYLAIHHDLINATMLVRLASHFAKSCTLITFDTMELLPEISLQLIFYLFPNLVDLCICVDGVSKWLDDLLEIRKTGLEGLKIKIDMPDDANELFSIKSKSLYDFCRTQPPGFKLEIFFITGYDFDAEPPPKETYDFIKPYFRETQDRECCNLIIGNLFDEDFLWACYA